MLTCSIARIYSKKPECMCLDVKVDTLPALITQLTSNSCDQPIWTMFTNESASWVVRKQYVHTFGPVVKVTQQWKQMACSINITYATWLCLYDPERKYFRPKHSVYYPCVYLVLLGLIPTGSKWISPSHLHTKTHSAIRSTRHPKIPKRNKCLRQSQ